MNNNSKKIAYALYLPLFFPEGIAPGCGSTYNRLLLARNGQGHPVLRGTALAGALRHAYDAQNCGADVYFGSAKGQELKPSRLKFQDSRLILPDSIDYRTHHQRNRHTGVVLDGALFSLESCPPRTESETVLWLESDEETSENDLEFLAQIVRFFSPRSGGFYVGGNVARGIGRAVLRKENPARLRVFDLFKPDDWAAWFTFRSGAGNCTEWDIFEPEKNQNQNRLTVQFTLTIPSGQDLLIADGDMAPQRVTGADGKIYWRIPGSTMRGLFRSFILRLASRAGKTIGDSIDKWQNLSKEEYTGDSLAWAFMDKLLKKTQLREDLKKYPVETLFGTAFQRGKIHFSDAYSPCGEQWNFLDNSLCEEEQRRMHVKIDPISGGAVPLALFSNTVLTSAKSPKFDFTMTVDQPTEEEAKWLAQTLRALDFGLLRLGTTKASGRVKLVSSPTASCPTNKDWERYFTEISPSTDFEFPIVTRKNTPLKWKPSILYINGNMRKAKHPERDSIITIGSVNVVWHEKDSLKNGDEISIVWKNGKITHICPRGKEAEAETKSGSNVSDNQNLLDSKFHNPYTFIPFSSKIERGTRLLQTEDEVQNTLKSGVIEVEVTTVRPLISLHPVELTGKKNEDKFPARYNALTIGEDVIVPATSIRGQLRSLSTILTGSSLSTLDMDCWIYEHQRGTSVVDEKKLFLAEVLNPGNSSKPGTIRLFKEVRLVSRNALVECLNSKDKQSDFNNFPEDIKNKRFILENVRDFPVNIDPTNMLPVNEIVLERRIRECAPNNSEGWRVRPSGTPVGLRYTATKKLLENLSSKTRVKKEAMVRGEGLELVLPQKYWRQYEDVNPQNRHPLEKGTIIWLEPADDALTAITNVDQIRSIQWTRWSKKTRMLCEGISSEYWPDFAQSKPDQVDAVTNLFGQVNSSNYEDVPEFAGRIRAENLVFSGAKKTLENLPLAPLAQPHVGCFQFYKKKGPKGQWMFRGYKVYRVSKDDDTPWKYGVQFVCDNQGKMEDFNQQNQGKWVQKLPAGQIGHVRIAFRGLTDAELALLYTVCTTKWRLGSGKPFGLGLCATRACVQLWNDDGTISAPSVNSLLPAPEIANRKTLWEATQQPVAKVRYPRAGNRTQRNALNNNIHRGGHCWFSLFSSAQGNYTLKDLHMANGSNIPGQLLPEFDIRNPSADWLDHLDIVPIVGGQNNGANQITELKPYSEIGLPENPGDCDNINNSLNAQMRQENRMARLPEKLSKLLRKLGIQ